MAKGSNFERDICKQLSLWWSYGKFDDIFWRTSGSGARATVRSKKGQATFGQYGDVQATDPQGQYLIDICTIEIKRGYSKSTFADLIEKSESAAEQTYEKFLNQVIIDSKKADSFAWMLIVKRDRKEAIIFIPLHFYKVLRGFGSSKSIPCSILYLEKYGKIFVTTLKFFLQSVHSFHIKKIPNRKKMKRIQKPEKMVVDKLSIEKSSKCILCEKDQAVQYNKAKRIWICTCCGNEFYDRP